MNQEQARKLLEETQANYNRNAEDFSRARQEGWSETEFLVDDYLIKGDKVLDLGCGNGRYFELMKDKEVDYFGVDNSEELIKIAREHYSDFLETKAHSDQARARFKVKNCLELSFPDNYFDIGYSFAVLHHIPSEELRKKFLKEAERVLKPDSFFIVTVWNVWNFRKKEIIKNNLLKIIGLSRLDFNDIKTSFGGLDKIYVHCFEKKELIDLVQQAGFKVKKAGFVDRENKSKANIFVVANKTS